MPIFEKILKITTLISSVLVCLLSFVTKQNKRAVLWGIISLLNTATLVLSYKKYENELEIED